MNQNMYYDLMPILARIIRAKKYLELGIDQGQLIRIMSGTVERCVGVDIQDIITDKNGFVFRQCSTDAFFASNDEYFDMIFIDALHQFEQIKIDFNNSIKYLNTNGIICLHDTDPESKECAAVDYAGDCYKMVKYIHDNYAYRFDILTLPTDNSGITIVKSKLNRYDCFMSGIEEIS